MKLTARKDIHLDNDYVDIQYRELTPAIHQIFQICEDTGAILLCERDGATCRVDANDVLYIEWVDNRSCVYTSNEVFTLPAPLSHLESSLAGLHFKRISKMTLVNIYKIRSISSGLHSRLTAEMDNGEQVVINRHYRSALLAAIRDLARGL